MNTTVHASPARSVFQRADWKETSVVLIVAWLVPFLVHLLPWGGAKPLGAYLLPMFWTAFVAVYLFGLRTGLLAGLVAPVINVVVTGMPSLQWVALIGLELVVFVFFAWWAVRRGWQGWWLAPLGYLMAKTVSMVVRALAAASFNPGAYVDSLRVAVPGLIVLTAVNFALRQMYPKPSPGLPDDATGV